MCVGCVSVFLSQKIAPRGWTKEINPLSQTPIYTSSRTGERVSGRDIEGGREGESDT